jgi:hypothetical protein
MARCHEPTAELLLWHPKRTNLARRAGRGLYQWLQALLAEVEVIADVRHVDEGDLRLI